MKKIILSIISILLFSISGFSQSNLKNISKSKKPSKEIIALRKQHAKFLAHSPFKETLKMSEDERMEHGIPPNKYYEQEWELTMSPILGRPTPENVKALRNKLEEERQQALANNRTPGDASDNNWVERGPTNVGGRTRAIMFDPNDPTKETVFAGGVSGGLWKNTNISNASSTWSLVNIPDNLAISCITYDPNNTQTFYIGTGESYVGGDVNGDGVWKSTNGGLTWTHVFGGVSGATTFQNGSPLVVNSPASVAGNYANYPTTSFGTVLTTPITNDVVWVNDSSGFPTEGCNPLTNGAAVSGKIALMKRGNCTFVSKVLNAQNAGAIAVIMINNVDGQPIPMGGTDATITIPSMMISKADGILIENALTTGAVNVTLNPTPAGGFTGNYVPGQQHINDIKIRNNAGVSEIYVAAGDSFYGSANATTYLGGPDFGLYKSNNGGSNWSQIQLPLTSNGQKHCPNDIAIGSDNKIWLSTLKSAVFNDGGGQIFSSTDGTNFTSAYTISGADRTQIEASTTTAGKVFVLAELSAGGVTMLSTTNAFSSVNTLALPDDADTGITPADFTRSQAFYDLMLQIDPSNDQIVYTGGIDLFRTANGGTSWQQISKWSNNNNLAALTCSLVHSDQHALALKPGDSNIGLFGNDGGVFYCSSLSASATSANITSRNLGFNVTQFYSVGTAPTGATGGNLVNDYYVAGAQDNGTQYFASVGTGANPSVQAQSGDGAISHFDQGADKYYITNYVYNQSINYRTTAGTVRTINSETTSNGAFIAPMELDSSLDILYADYYTTTPVYQIRRYSSIKSGTVVKTLLTNALLTSPATALKVSKYTTTSTTLLVGTRGGKLLKLTTANTTPTWVDITGSGFVGSISDIEFGTSESEIFVTMHNYNVVSIWYSNNGGNSWQNKEGNFPDIPVKCILQNPLNAQEVIIGTELGVWYTNNFSNASPSWNQSYNGMRNVKVTDLDVRNDNAVYAATYGRGVFSGVFTAPSLGNQAFELNKSVSIFPNPSNGIYNLKIDQFIGKIQLQITDINGKIIYNTDNESFENQKNIDLTTYQSGIYFIKITGDKLNYTQKLIKN